MKENEGKGAETAVKEGQTARFAELREKLGFTQDKFGEKLGMSNVAVSLIELGKTTVNEKHIKLIAGVFGVNEEWLRSGNGVMFKTGADILDDEGKPLTYEEGKFINTYRKLTEPNKEVARTTVDALLKSQKGAAEEVG
jgi:transcriptional regulator with XRE-family HTH domain